MNWHCSDSGQHRSTIGFLLVLRHSPDACLNILFLTHAGVIMTGWLRAGFTRRRTLGIGNKGSKAISDVAGRLTLMWFKKLRTINNWPSDSLCQFYLFRCSAVNPCADPSPYSDQVPRAGIQIVLAPREPATGWYGLSTSVGESPDRDQDKRAPSSATRPARRFIPCFPGQKRILLNRLRS